MQPNTCFGGVRESEACSERTISPPLTWPSTWETWLGVLLLIFSAVGPSPSLEEGSAQRNFLRGKGQKGEHMNSTTRLSGFQSCSPVSWLCDLGQAT